MFGLRWAVTVADAVAVTRCTVADTFAATSHAIAVAVPKPTSPRPADADAVAVADTAAVAVTPHTGAFTCTLATLW